MIIFFTIIFYPRLGLNMLLIEYDWTNIHLFHFFFFFVQTTLQSNTIFSGQFNGADDMPCRNEIL